jgi:hypothetical protein
MNSREELLALDDIATKVIEVPEWKCSVKIRQPSLLGLVAIENAENTAARIVQTVIAGVINDDGTPKFQSGDEAQLLAHSPSALMRLSKAINDLCLPVNNVSIEAEAKN